MDGKKTSMSSPRSCCSNEGDSTSLNTTQEDAAYSSSEEDSISLAQRTSKLALSPIRRRLQTSVGSESDSDFWTLRPTIIWISERIAHFQPSARASQLARLEQPFRINHKKQIFTFLLWDISLSSILSATLFALSIVYLLIEFRREFQTLLNEI